MMELQDTTQANRVLREQILSMSRENRYSNPTLLQRVVPLIIAALIHLFYFIIINTKPYIMPLDKRPYSIIPVKTVTLTPETKKHDSLKTPFQLTYLSKPPIATPTKRQIALPTVQEKTENFTVKKPDLEPIEVLKNIPQKTVSRPSILTPDISNINPVLEESLAPISRKDRLKRFQIQSYSVGHNNSQRQRTCEQQIRNIEFILDRPAKPCLRHPAIMPKDATKSGYCYVKYTVLSNGRTKDILIDSCTDDIFREVSLKAVNRWLFFPEIKSSRPVETKAKRTKLIFKLRDQYGIVIN